MKRLTIVINKITFLMIFSRFNNTFNNAFNIINIILSHITPANPVELKIPIPF